MDWTHLHLALNHVPVVGPPFLLIFLLWSWARREMRTLRFCLFLLVTLALATLVLIARTANSGGRIRHPEIRPPMVSKKGGKMSIEGAETRP